MDIVCYFVLVFGDSQEVFVRSLVVDFNIYQDIEVGKLRV